MTKKMPAVLPWAIWFLAALFYFYENLVQVSPSVMVHDLMADFSVSAVALGNMSAFFFYSYASMQIPVGVLVDRYSVRVLLTIATLACVVGCFLFGYASSLAYASAGRFFIGFGAAFAAVCTMKLAANWFPASKFPLLVGLMVTIGMAGSIVGEKPFALLVEVSGWRHGMILLGIIGTALAVIIYAIVRNGPQSAQHQQDSSEPKQHLLQGLKCVLVRAQSWVLAIYGGLMFASTSIFGGLWGVPFIQQAYHVARPQAAGTVAFLFLGWVVGSPLTGWLASVFDSRKRIMLVGSVGALFAMSAIIFMPMPIWLLSCVIFSFGVFSSCFLPSFSLIKELHSHKNSGAALGFMNMANMLGGALGQPFVGWVLDLSWSGQFKGDAKVYALQDYQTALLTLPIMIAISIILLFFIDEKPVVRD